MSNGKTVINARTANSLANELTNLGQAMLSLGQKIEKLVSQPKVKEVKVTPETDPDMFTKEFISTVRKSRKDIEKGRVYDYFKIRNSLGLK
jgi:hypothetical protein